MPPLYTTFFILILVSCNTNIPQHVYPQYAGQNQPKIAHGTTKELDFPNYLFCKKDTIRMQHQFGHYSDYIHLGKFRTDSITYQISILLRHISFVEGFKTRSILEFTSYHADTLQFEARNPHELPVDIHQNHFVFLNADSTYSFSSVEINKNELVCFSYNRQCFTRW